jgi:hypothetical protein
MDNDMAFEYDEDVVEEGTGDSGEKKGQPTEGKKEEQSPTDNSANNDDGEDDSGEGDDISPAEERARSEGWAGKDDWKGDPDDWVDYREFNYRGQLMNRIKSQSTQIHTLMDETKDTKEALAILGEHNKKIALTEYNRALKDLKEQRKEAREEDDLDAIDDIEESIAELKDAKKDLEKEPEKKKEKEVQGLSPEQTEIVKEWYSNNKWYEEDVFLQPIADKLFITRLEENKGDFAEAFDFMETKIKKRFPEEFKGSNSRKGSSVTESSGRSTGKQKSGSKSKFSAKDMTEEQTRVGRTFVNNGVFDNMQEYVDQLAATGELG